MTKDHHSYLCKLTRTARIHLKYLCDKTLQRDNLTLLHETAELRSTDHLISIIKSQNEQRLEEFLIAFIHRTENVMVTHAMAKLLSLLAGDAPISAVVPFRHHPHILETCAAIRNNQQFHNKLHDMNEYGMEISRALLKSAEHGCALLCVDFVEYLVDKVLQTHLHDHKTQEPSVIPNSYNPENGTAYYFTPHGNQLRKQPRYTIDQKHINYDDLPDVDDMCQKKFPRVSYGGYGYMFLWFCPIHGHCYGFHLISGAEGRKDPFSSLYKYLPEAPQDVFYDFACQYSEYCLNREPCYFRCTRFWHDLFHGIPHKCGKAFKSSRVSSLTGINSEICEQFNSYLQCVKYTGSHHSQPHFMFFVQFFIYLWNTDKTTKFQNIVHIALAGAM